jgi:hypothetical protein
VRASKRCPSHSAQAGVKGKPDQARPLFERALTITEAAYGPNHPRTVTVQRNLEAFDE